MIVAVVLGYVGIGVLLVRLVAWRGRDDTAQQVGDDRVHAGLLVLIWPLAVLRLLVLALLWAIGHLAIGRQ
jgi:hypothetical protein